MPGRTRTPELRGPHPLDVHLGGQIRRIRKRLRVSQDRLAGEVGVTFQQIQKYERGTNRVSFSMLVLISRALDCRVQDLIGDLENDGQPLSEAGLSGAALLDQPHASELLEGFRRLRSEKARRLVLNLVSEMAASADES